MKSSIPADTYALELPCGLAAIRAASRQVRAVLAESGLTEGDLDVWELLLAEAGNNAVQYTPAERCGEPIRIELSVTAAVVEARLFDHTDGFDYPAKALLPPPFSESGRGLFLIQSLTDDTAYFRSREENCLVLKKERQPPGKTAASGRAEPALQAQLAEAQTTLDLMTAELASSYESLSAMFRFSAELAEQPKPEEFARQWLGELLGTVQADWFVLRLVADNGGALKLVACSAAAGVPEKLSLENAGVADVSSEGRAASLRMDVWFDPLHPVAAADPLAKLAGGGSGFTHPVVINDQLVGVLSVGRLSDDATFDAGHVSVIQTFADFLGIQIRNAQYHEQQLQTRLTARELEIAAEIQHSLLTQALPAPPGFRLQGHCQSARQVGGDFYDAFVTADGGLLLAIADVMGKGVPAAMFAAIFRSQLRAGMERATAPAAMLAWLNRMMFADLDRVEMFITARLVYVNLERRSIHLAAAGHPPLLLAGAGIRAAALGDSGMPLGVKPDAVYAEQIIPLPPGANLLLFTDGLTEARDPEGKLLGLAALENCLTQALQNAQSPEQTKAALIALVVAHQRGAAASDDETFLLLTETETRPPGKNPASYAI